MAEAWTRHLKRNILSPVSAGVYSTSVHPHAITVMKERNVPMNRTESQTIHELQERDYDYIVTLCEPSWGRCPAFLTEAKIVRRGFPNPVSKTRGWDDETRILDEFRRLRDNIRNFVQRLPGILDRQ